VCSTSLTKKGSVYGRLCKEHGAEALKNIAIASAGPFENCIDHTSNRCNECVSAAADTHDVCQLFTVSSSSQEAQYTWIYGRDAGNECRDNEQGQQRGPANLDLWQQALSACAVCRFLPGSHPELAAALSFVGGQHQSCTPPSSWFVASQSAPCLTCLLHNLLARHSSRHLRQQQATGSCVRCLPEECAFDKMIADDCRH